MGAARGFACGLAGGIVAPLFLVVGFVLAELIIGHD
jgi:hypothetical protein